MFWFSLPHVIVNWICWTAWPSIGQSKHLDDDLLTQLSHNTNYDIPFLYNDESVLIAAPLLFMCCICYSHVKMLLTVSLSNQSISLPDPPLLIGQVTGGSSVRSIRTSAPIAPAWTAAHVSTRSTPTAASAPQVRLPYRCRGGGGGGGRKGGEAEEEARGQGAQRSISPPSPSLCASLAPSVSLKHKHTRAHTQTPFWTGTNPSPEAGLRRPG